MSIAEVGQVLRFPEAQRIQAPGLAMAFTPEEIEEARRAGTLLSLDIQLTNLCNFRCEYCYAIPNEKLPGELSLGEVLGIIDQARELGLRVLTLTGGEPLLDEKFFPVAEYAASHGINVLMFSNASRLSLDVARRLIDLRVSPCIKLDSLDPAIQNAMADRRGSAEMIMGGIDNLIAVGYTTTYPVLAVNAAVCRTNIDGIPVLWRWARERNIKPSVSRLQSMGRAAEIRGLDVTPLELRSLYRSLSEVDASFGIEWEPDIPWHGGKACTRYLIGGYVTSQGSLQPCSGVPITAGNLRERSLKEVLSTSPVMSVARNIKQHVEGACGSCESRARCYGCRSVALYAAGSWTAADPSCWKAQDCAQITDARPSEYGSRKEPIA